MTAIPLRALAILVVFVWPAHAATLIVSNSSDLVNGNTSSPEALTATPGADGISLREAIQAVHRTPGPHTIAFAPSLVGQTIALQSGLNLLQDGVTISGIQDSDGSPGVTIDANAITANNAPIALQVRASNVSIRHLRFVRIRQVFAIRINAGQAGQVPGTFPQRVENIEVSDNAFDNSAFPNSHNAAVMLEVSAEAVGASLSSVAIARNTFANFTGESDGIQIGVGGTENVIRDVIVSANRFTNTTFPVELAPGPGTNNQIRAVRIVGNTFLGNEQAVTIGAIGTIGSTGRPAVGAVIDGTWIADNVFASNRAAMMILGGATNANRNVITNTTIVNNTFTANTANTITVGGAQGRDGQPVTSSNLVDGTLITNNVFEHNRGPAIGLLGGEATATGNAVMNTTIVNNLIRGTTRFGGIVIVAGRASGRLNRIERVSVINNTIVGNVGGGVVVNDDPDRTGGNNTNSGVSVRNSIVVGNTSTDDGSRQDFAGVTAGQVSYSLVGQSGFAGAGGNMSDDPRFAGPSRGDYHLQATSPAIDAANSAGAPLTDLEGRRRIDDPGSSNRGAGPFPHYDMGAYEFGSFSAAPPTFMVSASGPITSRVISLNLSPPSPVLDQSGSVFVWAALPLALGGRILVMSADGGWLADLKCEIPRDAFSGRLRSGIEIAVVSEGSDLSQLQGAVIYAGYGLGLTAAGACADMLNYSTFVPVYRID